MSKSAYHPKGRPRQRQYRSLRGVGFHFQQALRWKAPAHWAGTGCGWQTPPCGYLPPTAAGARWGASWCHPARPAPRWKIATPARYNRTHPARAPHLAAELRFKHNACPQFLYQPALPRNAEFFREVRFNMRDLRQRVSHLSLVLFLCPGMLLLPPQNPLQQSLRFRSASARRR